MNGPIRLMKFENIARIEDDQESRLQPVHTCWGCGILPGTPDPTEAGTPIQRCLDENINFIRRHYDTCRLLCYL